MHLLHNHTTWCDGKNSMDEMLETALQNNVDVFGFSSHSPLPFDNPWSIKDWEQAKFYSQTITKLKQKYAQSPIHILAGLEVDYVPGISVDFDVFRNNLPLDYLIGSIHLVENNGVLWFIDGAQKDYFEGIKRIFDNDIRKAVSKYYQQMHEMIENETFEILAHMDKVVMNNAGRLFKSSDSWHIELVEKIISSAAKKDIIIEINTRGQYTGKHPDFYPGEYLFPLLKKYGNKVIISTDAHRTEEISSGYNAAEIALLKFGINYIHYPLLRKIRKSEI